MCYIARPLLAALRHVRSQLASDKSVKRASANSVEAVIAAPAASSAPDHKQ